MKRILLSVAMLGVVATAMAQFTLNGEIRPRFEYNHGTKSLVPDDKDPATFVTQRTRLNAGYKVDYLDFYLSLQDVRVWGDVEKLNKKDVNGVGIHQAWAEIKLSENFSTKFGRQEINYDDARIMGDIRWAQQAFSHDAMLLKYNRNKFKFHFGFAYNQQNDKQTYYDGNYTLKHYKALQYVWMHNDWDKLSGSFLFLNNGMQGADKILYSQTIGTHLKTKGNFNLMANLYYQFGKDGKDKDLSAYLLGLEGNYKVSDKTNVGLGLELQSGSNYDTKSGKNNSFTPFYGTNHKFNGLMDYFYVGNHIGEQGLLDIYGKANFKVAKTGKLIVSLHNFSTAVEMQKDKSKQLGTELDLAYAYKLHKDISISAGYAHMFASEGMEILKGGSKDNTNNCAWLMITVKPTLFTTKKEIKE